MLEGAPTFFFPGALINFSIVWLYFARLKSTMEDTEPHHQICHTLLLLEYPFKKKKLPATPEGHHLGKVLEYITDNISMGEYMPFHYDKIVYIKTMQ